MFKVPKKTSVFKNHKSSGQDTISFAPELIKFIQEKKKFLTYRFADEKYQKMQIGNVVFIKEYGGGIISKAKIISKKSTTFLELPLNTPGHETAKDKEHQRKVLSGYYAFLGRPIADNDPFLIIEFKLF